MEFDQQKILSTQNTDIRSFADDQMRLREYMVQRQFKCDLNEEKMRRIRHIFGQNPEDINKFFSKYLQ